MPTAASTVQNQAITLELAARHGEGWTSSQLATVQQLLASGATHADIALACERSLYSIENVIKALRDGQPVGSDRKPADRPYRGWMEGDGDE